MNTVAELVLLAWLPIGLTVFAVIPPRRACLVTVFAGWMFLPFAEFELPGFIDYDKHLAVVLPCIVALPFFDLQRLVGFRPGIRDIPVVVLCVMPGLSTLANGYDSYLAMSRTIDSTIHFGLPYLLGRLYFYDQAGTLDIALAVLLGGLTYVPLCLYEIRMSPQLHVIVYGYHQHSFLQTMRGDGFRPVVFLSHGLSVGLFMSMASLTGICLWRYRVVRSVCHIPMGLVVVLLIGTSILCKSTGATVLVVVGLALLSERWLTGRTAMALALLLAPPLYLCLRVAGVLDLDGLVSWIAEFSPERARSLGFRLDNEKLLIQASAENRWIGRGPFEFNAVYGAKIRTSIVGDSVWIILLTRSGVFSVIAFIAMFSVPIYRSLFERIPRTTSSFAIWPTIGTCLLMLYLDCMFNFALEPVYLLMLGGLTYCTATESRAAARASAAQAEVREPAVAERHESN